MSPLRSSHSQTCAATSKSHATSGTCADALDKPEKLKFIKQVPWAIDTAQLSPAFGPSNTATPLAGPEATASSTVQLAWPSSEVMPVSIMAYFVSSSLIPLSFQPPAMIPMKASNFLERIPLSQCLTMDDLDVVSTVSPSSCIGTHQLMFFCFRTVQMILILPQRSPTW